jgi:hypothetical protein
MVGVANGAILMAAPIGIGSDSLHLPPLYAISSCTNNAQQKLWLLLVRLVGQGFGK